MSRIRVLELLPELPSRFPKSRPAPPPQAKDGSAATHLTARTGRTVALGAAGIGVAILTTLAVLSWIPDQIAAHPAPTPAAGQTLPTAAMLPEPAATLASVIPPRHNDTNAKWPSAVPTRAETRAVLPPPIADSGNPLRIRTTLAVVDPTLVHAFEAMNTGDLAGAEAGYAQVLASDARNADALLGMAAVELRRGRQPQAEALYLRAVDADPSNAPAHAGLLGLRGNRRGASDESRLKTLIAAQPDQPALHFALGNAYAADQRWNDAEQHYFLACTADPGQPDYLFNLAVSLDRLRQSTLAAEYYRRAVSAAAVRPALFDAALAATRLLELPDAQSFKP